MTLPPSILGTRILFYKINVCYVNLENKVIKSSTNTLFKNVVHEPTERTEHPMMIHNLDVFTIRHTFTSLMNDQNYNVERDSGMINRKHKKVFLETIFISMFLITPLGKDNY